MKNRIIIAVCIFIAIILLIPIPIKLRDGGTVVYEAILYSVQDVHRINPDIESEQEYMESEQRYTEGTIIEILGFEVFDNVRWP